MYGIKTDRGNSIWGQLSPHVDQMLAVTHKVVQETSVSAFSVRVHMGPIVERIRKMEVSYNPLWG